MSDMKDLVKPRGFRDLTGDICKKMAKLYEIFQKLALKYNCTEIRTPTIEYLDLFVRGIKEGTDVVDKEMFSFNYDDEKLCLIPEGTSGTVRAFINEGIFNKRVFYYANFFRKERPQKGRYREFFSIGAEFIGRKDIFQDIDCINLAVDFFNAFNVKFQLKINTIGTLDERKKYVEVLEEYFKDNIRKLSNTSLERLANRNILRILDSKEDDDVIAKAPSILDYIGNESLDSFNKIQEFLKLRGIMYDVCPTLVRGLDYYNNLVFEFIGNEFNGSQNTICGGGRYDGLFAELGGQSTAAVGWGLGIDRMLEIMEYSEQKPQTIAIASDNFNDIFELSEKLRNNGYSVEIVIKQDKLLQKFRKTFDFLIVIDNGFLVENLKTRENQFYNKIEDVLIKF